MEIAFSAGSDGSFKIVTETDIKYNMSYSELKEYTLKTDLELADKSAKHGVYAYYSEPYGSLGWAYSLERARDAETALKMYGMGRKLVLFMGNPHESEHCMLEFEGSVIREGRDGRTRRIVAFADAKMAREILVGRYLSKLPSEGPA